MSEVTNTSTRLREALEQIANGETADGKVPDWEFAALAEDRERQIKEFAAAVLAAAPEPECCADPSVHHIGGMAGDKCLNCGATATSIPKAE